MFDEPFNVDTQQTKSSQWEVLQQYLVCVCSNLLPYDISMKETRVVDPSECRK